LNQKQNQESNSVTQLEKDKNLIEIKVKLKSWKFTVSSSPSLVACLVKTCLVLFSFCLIGSLLEREREREREKRRGLRKSLYLCNWKK